jgi:hypothetical protein
MDGWMGGWVGGCKSRFKDCLQQSKIILHHSYKELVNFSDTFNIRNLDCPVLSNSILVLLSNDPRLDCFGMNFF